MREFLVGASVSSFYGAVWLFVYALTCRVFKRKPGMGSILLSGILALLFALASSVVLFFWTAR